jgi:hypothetical protein
VARESSLFLDFLHYSKLKRSGMYENTFLGFLHIASKARGERDACIRVMLHSFLTVLVIGLSPESEAGDGTQHLAYVRHALCQ